jgi:hypothetical protein
MVGETRIVLAVLVDDENDYAWYVDGTKLYEGETSVSSVAHMLSLANMHKVKYGRYPVGRRKTKKNKIVEHGWPDRFIEIE